jgi:glycosyltransferase involved in cell wall biosynthesis
MFNPTKSGYDADYTADGRLLEQSGLFYAETYRAAAGIDGGTNAAEHYLLEGWRAGLEPGPDFEGGFLYPYYRSVGLFEPPPLTYITLRAAGWPVYAARAQAEQMAAVIRASDLFDAGDYSARLRLAADLDPALHYVLVGEWLGHAPSDYFDPDYYGKRYPDIAAAAICRFGHYILHGRSEGRRPLSVAAGLTFSRLRLNPLRKTVLIISHEATRTGAPIVAYNVAKKLRHRYNIVALLLVGGELVEDFNDLCAAVIGPITRADWDPIEADYIIQRLLTSYRIAYTISSSIESRLFIPPLASAFVPVVSLIHEFASYTRPKGAMGEGLDWSTQIVFSTDITANSAKSEHPPLANRMIHLVPQGRCELPRGVAKMSSRDVESLRKVFRPEGYDDALVVLGAGFVHIRKGIDLFLSCAAAVTALNPKRPVRFIWIGGGYDPEKETTYSPYLAEQVARSGLEDKIAIVDPIEDLEAAYAMTDIFFLSSRLDPLPNVTIDAAFHGLPVVCFENASGMAALLADQEALRSCVVPHLDVQAAARVIADFANDESARRRIGDATRRFAQATFDIDSYVRRLDELGREAVDIMRQRTEDFITIRDDPLFDENIFLPPGSTIETREEAIRHFLLRWAAVGTSRKPAANFHFRRPCAGFHPQIYAHENSGRYDAANINPLAHFIRSGKPDGPWCHEVIRPSGNRAATEAEFRTGLHVHFYYPELATDLLRRLYCNHSRCDLLLTTDTRAKANCLRSAATGYPRGEVVVRLVPNRGRDIGAFLTAFGDALAHYDVVGHMHSKRSTFDPVLGETWREFLWQNLLGDLYPMMDIILDRFAADDGLGIIFAADPHLCDWDDNEEIATALAKKMEIEQPLPPFFEFPNGTMFWARAVALKPLFDLRLGWDEYPDEPAPYDGTILHALERLLPFAVRRESYRFASTHVPGITW